MHSFFPRIIDAIEDGYWIEKFPFHCANDDLHPSVIAYGLGTKGRKSNITIFHNQYHSENTLIAQAKYGRLGEGDPRFTLVPCDYGVRLALFADISGNGYNDVIIADRYGPSMDDIWSDGGRIQRFENIGDPRKEQWQPRYIGQSPGMHRLRVGHFTRTDVIQIVALPVITKSNDLDTPVPVIIYTKPDDPMSASGWEKEIPFNSNFRVVHEVVVGVGKVHDDCAGYIASSEAMHGNHVTVYVKDEDTLPNQVAGVRWTRHVLDDFTSPGTGHAPGVIHQAVCADIDGDGVDEFLVVMGSKPPSWERTGVWCYKPVYLKNGKFAKFKLGDVSAGRVAIGNYRSPHVLDFATVSYSVLGYFESPIPLVLLYEAAPITAEKLNDDILFGVPRPDAIRIVDKVEFLDVAGWKMALVVVPPSEYPVKQGDGVKVIAGRVIWTDKDGKLHERTQAPAPFEASTITVKAEDDTISTRNEGGVFVLFEKSTTSGQPPFADMNQLSAHNLFPLRFPSAKILPVFNGRFKGDEFYNLVGFYVCYGDDSDEPICHIQLWTAGVNVSELIFKRGDTRTWPLWRTSADGMLLFRDNGTVDYPWHAWIAGNAFEFPLFISLAKEANIGVPELGTYRLINAKAEATATVEGGDSTDGASLTVSRSNLADQTFGSGTWRRSLDELVHIYTKLCEYLVASLESTLTLLVSKPAECIVEHAGGISCADETNGAQDTLVDKALGKAFSDLLELETNF
ncbi:hypothetical protein ARMGADRAFT_1076420 [Armillaria gallica]|uniref:Aldos-2-ulose dehydratase/isomerase (AUDH) Cupin domain-containing protein n=1 Tax=Armillaria gallica TaxID=47427 RepID=A0A2H3DRW9_ARMGA|nr:hypothetical protein ARMGADRAFT_1076420 [Armillaria gallica]